MPNAHIYIESLAHILHISYITCCITYYILPLTYSKHMHKCIICIYIYIWWHTCTPYHWISLPGNRPAPRWKPAKGPSCLGANETLLSEGNIVNFYEKNMRACFFADVFFFSIIFSHIKPYQTNGTHINNASLGGEELTSVPCNRVPWASEVLDWNRAHEAHPEADPTCAPFRTTCALGGVISWSRVRYRYHSERVHHPQVASLRGPERCHGVPAIDPFPVMLQSIFGESNVAERFQELEGFEMSMEIIFHI